MRASATSEAKADIMQAFHRSAEALRHPKLTAQLATPNGLGVQHHDRA